MRTVKKSDFSELANYITDDLNKNERVGKVSYTNCSANNLDGVIAEVLATQHQNKRAESDKTYHLIVSFRVGEHPDDETIRAVESRICEGLGYGDHQRMSAVHTDTDNLHLHIAINKIHPVRGTIHDPYNDHKTLGRLCEKLEKEYGFEPDNHKVQKRGAENRAADMEHHAGVESLLGWIKRECYAELKNAGSWNELHQVMADNGLELRERGNGFVVEAQDGTIIKASSIDRAFSKSKLEERFGSFEPSPIRQVDETPTKQYKAKPMRSRVDTGELYVQYQNEQSNLRVLRSDAWTKARDRKNDLIEAAKKKGGAKRAAVKLLSGGTSKKILYSAISKSVKKEIDGITKQYASDRQNIYEQYQRQAWADWLRKKATTGNEEALKALRARESSRGVKGNVVSGARDHQQAQAGSNITAKQDSITKQGTVIYQNGIRDDGSQLKVSNVATQQELKDALLMAMNRYGQRIAVKGTDDFKELILQVAVQSNLAIEFDNVELERRRQELLLQTTQEKSYDSGQQRATGNGRHASDYGSNGVDGFGIAGNDRTGSGRTDDRGGRTGTGEGLPKPDVGKIGQNPPPFRRNGLRGLSSLTMAVDRSQGRAVLLPGNVPGSVEQQGTKENIRLRRSVSSAGPIDAWVAADKYIQEREEKRGKLFDILKHSRYNKDASGAYAFAGIRQIEGQALALLQLNDEIFVLPVDKASVNRLKRISIGDQIIVEKGTIKTKGRSR